MLAQELGQLYPEAVANAQKELDSAIKQLAGGNGDNVESVAAASTKVPLAHKWIRTKIASLSLLLLLLLLLLQLGNLVEAALNNNGASIPLKDLRNALNTADTTLATQPRTLELNVDPSNAAQVALSEAIQKAAVVIADAHEATATDDKTADKTGKVNPALDEIDAAAAALLDDEKARAQRSAEALQQTLSDVRFQFVCYFFSYPSSVPGQARWDIPAAAASVGSWSASQRQPAQSDHVGGSTTLVQARSCYQPRPPQARGRRQATSRCQQAQTAV